MGTLWLKDIRGGLDTRRMYEALPGGSAIRANDGHITRGGEFEQRPAFVEIYTLPDGTLAFGADRSSLYVFGSGVAPIMPRGVLYQRLQHPDSITPLTRVLSVEMFQTKLYVVAEFSDGAQYHFYDGTRIGAWIEGRARASFRVTGGGPQPAVSASASFTITSGSASIVNNVESIKVNNVDILGAPVQHTGNNATTATAVAAQITSYVSNPNYTAVAVGAVVNITTSTAGVAANGLTPALVLDGDVLVAGITSFSGGIAAGVSRLGDLTINGVPIIAGPVDWSTSNEATASAIADAINNYASTPDYVATVVGDKVNLLALDPGAAKNGFTVNFSLERNLTITPSPAMLANGVDLSANSTYQSGSFAKTVGSKVYVTAGPYLNFSGVRLPTSFDTASVGAGFIDMSAEYAGSETLVSIARYLQYIAVFAARVIQIWFVDPDPDLNKVTQVLNNMGTLSARSVTQFGDNDLFFLDESGVRSLRARDASNAASTTDIGVPIDTLLVAKLAAMTTVQRSQVVGLIEPTSGRFWLVFPDQVFVLSIFEGYRISAWSTYTPAVNNVPFVIDDVVVLKKKVYVRSGNKIYVFGGASSAPFYDSTEPDLWLPYLDANTPAEKKQFRSIDAVCEGEWEVRVGNEPANINASEKVAIINKTTYNGDKIPYETEATHVSLRFKGRGAGYKKIAAAVIKFDGDEVSGGDSP